IARAQMSEAMSLASGLKSAVAEVYAQKGECPKNEEYGIEAAGKINGKYVEKVEVGDDAEKEGCTITATMKGSGVSSGIQGATLTLTMTDNDGSISWACSSSAAQKYLPTACTGS